MAPTFLNFWTANFFLSNFFSGPEQICWIQIVFGPYFFLTHSFFDLKFKFLTQNVFGHNVFLEQNLFDPNLFGPANLIDPAIFLTHNLFWTSIFFTNSLFRLDKLSILTQPSIPDPYSNPPIQFWGPKRFR